MNIFNKVSKSLKKYFKEKVTITNATIVGFLITGTVVMAGEGDYVLTVTESKIIENILTNENETDKHGVLNIYENNKDDATQVSVINNASIKQVGNGKAFAAVNISNGADFINDGTIVVDKEGALSGTAIEKGFGSLRQDMNISSNLENKNSITMENSRVAMGIKAVGYKKQLVSGKEVVGKDNVTITNTGNINISNLTSKEITGLEKMAWNVLNKFKITAGEGSIGVGIAAGDFVDVKNTGKIEIDNSTPMTVIGTMDGVEKEIKIGGVGIAATNAVEKAGKRTEVINEGEINLTGNNSLGIAGIKDVDIKNSGNIDVSGSESVGVFLSEGATLENKGQIILSGNENIGMYLFRKEGEIGKGLGTNTDGGEILIAGQESIGMYADNSEITNDGIIKLNIFQEDGKTLSNNKAMYGINEAIVKNTGSIYLTDVTSEKISEDELLKLNKYVETNLIAGDITSKVDNTGVIRNKDGAIIIAKGEDIGGLIPDLEVNENGDYIVTDEYVSNLDKNMPLTTDKTLAFNGDKLDLNINANSDFDVNRHLVSLENNEKVVVSGNLIGADKGIMIDNSTVGIENSKIEVNIANENNIALEFKNESKGNILETTVIGNISLNNKSDVKIESSSITGNINLDQSSNLSLDKSTAESFDGIIKGNNSGSKVVLGEDITRFNGTIENIDNVETNGILVMGEKSNFINSSIAVKDENLLVIRVGEGENDYALSDNVGTITLAENGHMMIETDRADIKPGDIITLGTTIVGDSENIYASQYIYDISLSEVATINDGSQLLVTLKNATDLGLDSQVSDVYESLANSGKLGELVSVGAGKDKNELNKILKQNSEENSYVLGYKASKDSIESWSDTVTNNINFLKVGEFEISGLAMGAVENTDSNLDYDFAGTGLMVMGEYGYGSNTTIGFALGGGAISGEMNSKNKVSGDSFYVSAFGKKAMDEIVLTGNFGYQFNKLDGKRSVGNAYENYNFKDKFDTNGFNVDLEGRYIYSLENDYTLEPHLGLSLVTIKQDSINEDSGDGALAMELDSIENTTLKTKVGVELAKNIVTNGGSKVKLFGDLSYVNNSGDIDKNIKGRFEGSTSDFDVKPLEIGKNKGEVSLGGKIETVTGIFADAKVTYSFGNVDYAKATVGVGYTF